MRRTIRGSGAAQAFTVAVGPILLGGCAPRVSTPSTQRLVDLYRPDQGSVARPPAPAAVEWSFDGPPPSPAPRIASATRGFTGLSGVSGLVVRQGRLVGRAERDFPLLHVERTSGLDDRDLLHEVQVRMRVSAPGNVSVAFRDTEKVDVDDVLEAARAFPWTLKGAQGRTLVPLLASSRASGTVKAATGGRPAISEKAITKETGAPPPRDTESAAIVSGGWKLIHNSKRPAGTPEFELYDHARDPLDRTDVAAQQPEVVQRLSRELAAWRQAAERARLKPDSESAGSLGKEELERLRSLGYIQ